MNCLACHKLIAKGEMLACRSCKSTFHYQCMNVTSAQFREKSVESKRSWQCQDCNNVNRRKRNDDTPIRQAKDSFAPMLGATAANSDEGSPACNSNYLNEEEPSKSSSGTISYEDFGRLLETKLESKLQGIAESITRSVQSSIKHEINSAVDKLRLEFTQTTDFLAEEQKDMKTEILNNAKTIQALQSENNRLSDSLNKLSAKLTNMDNVSRSVNLELHAVPERKDENILALFKKLCELTNATIDDSSIRACRRVARMHQSDRPRNILVTLGSSRQRDTIISAVHRYNKNHQKDTLSSSHLGISGTPFKIYVAEHLSPETKSLYAEARKVAKENNFKYVWVRFGKIYLRRDDTSGAILIKSLETLYNITS